MSAQQRNSEQQALLLPALRTTLAQLLDSVSDIPAERRALLGEAARYVAAQLQRGVPARLIFICTHNSRRSHMSQLWAQVAAFSCGLVDVETFSGGTEATAFHPNAIAALTRCGFRITKVADGVNPRYAVVYSDAVPATATWSKRYDDAANPDDGFAAVMTCSDADEACPFVPGAEARFPIRYEDPKRSDGSGREAEVYGASCMEIGREMVA
ncbi:MAG: protein-tyrosine-phosphatase, partial [Bacteroidota bacterium]|nr:protein-tyrosine-phosphatase [Bacteroidota bacterium]